MANSFLSSISGNQSCGPILKQSTHLQAGEQKNPN
jgi:hypothetical protein